jgi:hypothetical protein
MKKMCECCRKREAEISFPYSRSLCRLCFSNLLEKRCRNDLSLPGAIDSIIGEKKVLVLDDKSLESEAAGIFLSRIITDRRVRFITKKCSTISPEFDYDKIIRYAKNNSIKCVAVPWQIELEDEMLLSSVIEGKKAKIGAVDKKSGVVFIKLLRNASSAEIYEYARRISERKPRKIKKSPVYEMMESLEKKYAGVKFSILSSADFFRKISGKKGQD